MPGLGSREWGEELRAQDVGFSVKSWGFTGPKARAE